MRSSKPDKKHWVSDSKTTHCAHAGCGKVFDRFGLSGVRRHHCRVCGRVFCGEHSAHRLRLNSSAQYDATGEPQRVCEGCFRAAQEPEKPASSLAHRNATLARGQLRDALDRPEPPLNVREPWPMFGTHCVMS